MEAAMLSQGRISYIHTYMQKHFQKTYMNTYMNTYTHTHIVSQQSSGGYDWAAVLRKGSQYVSDTYSKVAGPPPQATSTSTSQPPPMSQQAVRINSTVVPLHHTCIYTRAHALCLPRVMQTLDLPTAHVCICKYMTPRLSRKSIFNVIQPPHTP
jgi:hypothetical protein